MSSSFCQRIGPLTQAIIDSRQTVDPSFRPMTSLVSHLTGAVYSGYPIPAKARRYTAVSSYPAPACTLESSLCGFSNECQAAYKKKLSRYKHSISISRHQIDCSARSLLNRGESTGHKETLVESGGWLIP